MKPLRYAPIDYRIALYAGGTFEVHGYAVDLPAPLDWLHICVRRFSSRWRIDHYETGAAICGPLVSPTGIYSKGAHQIQKRYTFDTGSRDGAARSAMRWLLYLHQRGELRPIIELAIAGNLGATRAYREEIIEVPR